MNVKMFEGENKLFRKCCELAGTPETARQFRKFKRGFGSASAKRREALKAFEDARIAALQAEWEAFQPDQTTVDGLKKLQGNK